ncbi:MAG: hypothetical protein JJE51_01960 [Thermoanaerobaculia bacterium]|nr:hypothetical protein [Thermoanaerobaculia bacterium]
MNLIATSSRFFAALLLVLLPFDAGADERFEAEERQHRAILASDPSNRAGQLGLARVHLWRGEYREAERRFGLLLRDSPNDAGALMGWAQAAYWSGDYRAAKKRFERILEVDPSNSDAKKALDDLRIVAAPRYEISGATSDDTQPMRHLGTYARLSYFSDPLTRWDARISAGRVEDDATNDALNLRGLAVGLTTAIPRFRLTVAASAERIAFEDDTSETLASGSLTWRVRSAEIALAADQYPLLGTATAIVSRETATRLRLTYRHEPAIGWQGAVNVERVAYSDENRGRGADLYLLMPILQRAVTPGATQTHGRLAIRAGFSAAIRDTEEDRFRFTSFRSEAIDGGFAYRFSGVYDPYWTPHDLREARVIGAVETSLRRATIKVQADAGIARERARAFGPATGETQIPQFTFPILLERTHHPWRSAIEITIPINGRAEFRARFRHEAAAFYDLNEFQASVGGRL